MSKTLTRQRVNSLLRAAARCRVVVVGDVMLDEFLWGNVRRISPEAPVPVVLATVVVLLERRRIVCRRRCCLS